MKTYYQILGVTPDAPVELIREAWRIKGKAAHPDNKETGDGELFRLLNEAKEVLLDADKRAAYDLSLRPQAATSASSDHYDPTAYPNAYASGVDVQAAIESLAAGFAVELGGVFMNSMLNNMSPRMRQMFDEAIEAGRAKAKVRK